MRAIGAHVMNLVDRIDHESSSYIMRLDVTFVQCQQPVLSPRLPPLFNYHSLPPSALYQNCIVNLYFQLSPIIVDSHELARRYFSKLGA